ncbi:MAG TPA: NADH-quinone oxidoreductase subunit C [Ktedonobacterales bacterium]
MADGQATQHTQVTEPEQPALFVPADPLAAATVTLLRERFPGDVLDVSEHRGEATVVLRPESIEQACLALRDAPNLRYNFMADLTAVDWPEREPRYDIVYHLLSLETRAVVRLKVRVGDDDTPSPEVPTVAAVWPAANFYEREVFDLFGVRFAGHPNLTRIMMPSDWVGHPLRKDYPLTGIHLPSPHWGGQIPLEQPLPPGTGQQTLRTPDGAEEPPAIGLQDD